MIVFPNEGRAVKIWQSVGDLQEGIEPRPLCLDELTSNFGVRNGNQLKIHAHDSKYDE